MVVWGCDHVCMNKNDKNATHIGINSRDVADMLHKAVGDGTVPEDSIYPWKGGGGENIGTERLTHVVTVLSLLKAVTNVGYWDWFIDVVLKDGTKIDQCDDGLRLETQEGVPPATHPGVDKVWLALQPGDGPPVRVLVSQIAKINVCGEH